MSGYTGLVQKDGATPVDSSNPLPIVTYTSAGVEVTQGPSYNSTRPTYTTGQTTVLQSDTRGNLATVLYGQNSANSITNAGPGADARSSSSVNSLDVVAYDYTYNGATWDRSTKANTVSRIVASAATTNATSAKASAGNVHTITAYNANAAVRYLKFYNKASSPTVGTDTPVMTIALPPTAVTHLPLLSGQYFSTGIAYALTTGSADADTGAVGANDILGLNVTYS